MWVPQNFGQAFALVILSLCCWGTWSNTAKEAARLAVPFAHFYSDWCFGGFATAALAWATLGGAEIAAERTDPTTAVGRYRVLSALAAGTIFNVANALLVVGINLAGLSVAFPMGIGTALVLGTILTYFVDSGNRPSQPLLLFGGVALGFIAVVAIAAADYFLRKGKESQASERSGLLDGADSTGSRRRQGSVPLVNGDDEENGRTEHGGFSVPGSSGGSDIPARKPPLVATAVGSYRPSALGSAGVCLGAGLLMSCWAPLSSYSMNNNASTPDGINPYASFLLFMVAVLLTSQKRTQTKESPPPGMRMHHPVCSGTRSCAAKLITKHYVTEDLTCDVLYYLHARSGMRAACCSISVGDIPRTIATRCEPADNSSSVLRFVHKPTHARLDRWHHLGARNIVESGFRQHSWRGFSICSRSVGTYGRHRLGRALLQGVQGSAPRCVVLPRGYDNTVRGSNIDDCPVEQRPIATTHHRICLEKRRRSLGLAHQFGCLAS